MHTEQVGRHSDHLDRDRQARQAGRRLGRRPHGRHDGARHRLRTANPREGIDFLPLTVDYREYTYASGRIPGGFFKREGKPTEKEVLTSRLIDRPIRPLFPSGWRYETQIIALCCPADTENDSDVLAITGASAALALSRSRSKRRSPACASAWSTAVRDQPDLRAAQERSLDLIVAGSKDGIVMVEAGARKSPKRRSCRRSRRARGHQARSSTTIDALAPRPARPKTASRQGDRPRVLPRGRREGLPAARRGDAHQGQARELRRVDQVLADLVARIPEDESSGAATKAIFKELKEKVMRDEILERGTSRRPAFDEIRPIWIEVGCSRAPTARCLHARRDAGARHRHARHRRRSAEDRDRRRRDVEALHAPLQLPAVLGRAKCSSCAGPAAARSATARWPSARWRR